MKLEATAAQVRLLLQLAEHSARRDDPAAAAHVASREALERDLPRRLLERCDSLLRAGRTPPIVALVSGACSGCHLRLPTMLASQAHLSPALHTCPHCRRLLYVPELLGEERQPGRKPAQRAAPAAKQRPSRRSRA